MRNNLTLTNCFELAVTRSTKEMLRPPRRRTLIATISKSKIRPLMELTSLTKRKWTSTRTSRSSTLTMRRWRTSRATFFEPSTLYRNQDWEEVVRDMEQNFNVLDYDDFEYLELGVYSLMKPPLSGEERGWTTFWFYTIILLPEAQKSETFQVQRNGYLGLSPKKIPFLPLP